MQLNVRSFVNDLDKDNQKLMAQEIHMSISDDFSDLIFMEGDASEEITK